MTENAKKLRDAAQGVIAANKNFIEVFSEITAEESTSESDLKQAIESDGSIVQAFFAINVAMKKLTPPITEDEGNAKKN